MKNAIKTIKRLILIVYILLVSNYIRLNVSYIVNKSKFEETIDIHGNTLSYTPQGLTYSPKYNVILQTSYNSKKDASMLYLVDYDTKKLIKQLRLIEVDDSDNYKHVGGIATNDSTVWITNDYEVNEYSLDEIIATDKTYIKSYKNRKLSNVGDFCCYHDNVLWIGDFFVNIFYKVPNNTPLLFGYKLDKELDYSYPDYIISLPNIVQGLAITDDNKFVFTTSFTSLIQSNLIIYDNVLEEEYEYYQLNDKSIPYYKLFKSNLIKRIKLPPMAEGVFYKDGSVYVLFESSSNTYRFAYPKVKKVIKVKLNE